MDCSDTRVIIQVMYTGLRSSVVGWFEKCREHRASMKLCIQKTNSDLGTTWMAICKNPHKLYREFKNLQSGST